MTGELPPNWHVRQWLADCIELCKPARVRVLDGSRAEYEELINEAVTEGVLLRLNQEKLPGCYLHRSNPNDVARTEHCTSLFARVVKTWPVPPTTGLPPKDAYHPSGRSLFAGCMTGRTLYAVPFVMGPPGSPLARVGVQITDSIYVAVSMGIMTAHGGAGLAATRRRPRFYALPPFARRSRSGAALYLSFSRG